MGNDLPSPIAGFKQAVVELAEAFAQLRVKHALIGGLACAYRSHPRSTKDIDLLVNVPQITLPTLLENLQRRGFEFDLLTTIREWTQNHMVVLSYQGIRVDWLKPVISVYDHVVDRAIEETWLNQPLRVASAEGLILLKLLAFRPQDQADIQSLIAANSDKLDVDWIKSEWQSIISLDDPRMRKFLEWVASNPQP